MPGSESLFIPHMIPKSDVERQANNRSVQQWANSRPYSVSVYQAGAASVLTSGIDATLDYDTVDWDFYAMANTVPQSLRCPRDGLYRVDAVITHTITTPPATSIVGFIVIKDRAGLTQKSISHSHFTIDTGEIGFGKRFKMGLGWFAQVIVVAAFAGATTVDAKLTSFEMTWDGSVPARNIPGGT